MIFSKVVVYLSELAWIYSKVPGYSTAASIDRQSPHHPGYSTAASIDRTSSHHPFLEALALVAFGFVVATGFGSAGFGSPDRVSRKVAACFNSESANA
jgi:hypothetical protein